MSRSFISLLIVPLALALTACAESGTGPDDNTNNGGSGTSIRTIVADPSFANVIQEIFNREGCATGNCHGAAAAASLELTAGLAYGNLVNVPSTQTGFGRVIPGDATNSYLMAKVEGRQSEGQQMPIGGSPLDNIDITNLKNWINEGAKNN